MGTVLRQACADVLKDSQERLLGLGLDADTVGWFSSRAEEIEMLPHELVVEVLRGLPIAYLLHDRSLPKCLHLSNS